MIRADILAAPLADRPRLKGLAFADQLTARSAARLSGDVEVRSIVAIPRGVEVMIRAWNGGGRPRGFGDGTVEIERIRIINPPIAVPDPAGGLNLDWQDDNGEWHLRRFREDLDEALFQALDHILRVAPTHGPDRIVRGKVGRTVSTFYAGAGDGFLESASASWDTAHDASGAPTVGTADDTTNPFRVNTGVFSAVYSIRRAFVPFPLTSDLPDTDVISAATLSLYVAALTSNGDNDGEDFYVPVGPTTQADPDNLDTADFDQCGAVDSPTELSDDRKDYGSHTLSTYADWALNAAGLAAISKTGYTLIGMREGHDILDHAYAGADNTSNQIRYASSEAATTTTDPVLVVTHAAAGGSILPLVAKDMTDLVDLKDMRG